jgi:hypothetical protein
MGWSPRSAIKFAPSRRLRPGLHVSVTERGEMTAEYDALAAMRNSRWWTKQGSAYGFFAERRNAVCKPPRNECLDAHEPRHSFFRRVLLGRADPTLS